MSVNYVLIGEFTTSVSTASVTLSNIPQTGYTDLKIVGSTRDDRSAFGSSPVVITHINGTSVTGGVIDDLGTNGSVVFGQSYSQIWAGQSTRVGQSANTFGVWDCYIPNYSVSGIAKTFTSDGAGETNATEVGLSLSGSSWTGTSAISSLTFTPSYATVFLANSTFYVYGLAALGTTPTILPKATGGDIITNDGTYWSHTFLSSGVFTPLSNLTCDYLVVAGGGGGGYGGGGAGGFRTGTAFSTITTPYAITVGAGGVGGANGTTAQGTNGSDSIFSTITSTGGGGGGGAFTSLRDGKNGGSGGGAGYDNTFGGTIAGGAGNTPSTSPSQGNNGGTGFGTSEILGGGGGAGAVGGNGSGVTSGSGGAGTSNSYSGSAVTYAGGGGGAGGFSKNAGAGGSGGGGAGSQNSNGTNGTVNTGGGGGGGNFAAAPNLGGTGGSGIVIIRYPMA
jgi:hypothetical protein